MVKVSVCIATYNGAKYIAEQLQSILDQIGQNDEVIISDDHSTDETINIVNSFNDDRIKIFYNEGEKGYTANFENSLNQISGDLIFLSDQDDIWLPGKYNAVVAMLSTNDLVVTNSMVTDEKLNIINESFFSIYNSGSGILKNLVCNTYYGSCMAFNKKVLNNSLPFPKNKVIGFDIWIGFVAEITGKVQFIKEPYLLYRRSDFTVTELGNLLSRSKRSLFFKIYKRIIILINISIFSLKFKLNIKK